LGSRDVDDGFQYSAESEMMIKIYEKQFVGNGAEKYEIGVTDTLDGSEIAPDGINKFH
jgi:hypothetical protein